MTKKHFDLIARVIASLPLETIVRAHLEQWDDLSDEEGIAFDIRHCIAQEFANALAKTNLRFNPVRFVVACVDKNEAVARARRYLLSDRYETTGWLKGEAFRRTKRSDPPARGMLR